MVAFAAPLYAHFCAGHGIAAVGDDSVSYLALARHFAGTAGPLLAPWVGYQSHFPPLFPLALALAGGAGDLAVAHLVVAAFAAAALAMVQRYGALRLGRDAAGFALAAAFLLTPTAWVCARGILSEPMFLFVSLVALHYHARRIEGRDAGARSWLVFGVLVAAATLTRAVGAVLVVAFAAQVGWRAIRMRRPPAARLLLALLPLAALEALWIVLRPVAGTDTYARTGGSMVAAWLHVPGLMLSVGVPAFFDAWVTSFGAVPQVQLAMRVVFAAVGLLAIAGSVRAALAHRLDGWYVLASLAVTFAWVFGEDNSRRLLYPVLPLLLLHAAEALAAAVRRAGAEGPRLAAVGLAFPAVLCVPGLWMVQARSLDRSPVAPSSAYCLADATRYYTVGDAVQARALAAKEAAVLGGFEALGRVTPPGARIMWMRPEYVALLGGRAGVPFYYDWDAHRVAAEIRASQADYVLLSALFKIDLRGGTGNPMQRLASVAAYTHPVLSARNAETGSEEFVLLEVDRAALHRALAAGG